jgi:hypothetical protein
VAEYLAKPLRLGLEGRQLHDTSVPRGQPGRRGGIGNAVRNRAHAGTGVTPTQCAWPALKTWPQRLTAVDSRVTQVLSSTSWPSVPNSMSKPLGVRT